MLLNKKQKESLKQNLVDCLQAEKEVQKIVIFGSFIHSSSPQDLDVAVFQDSTEKYLPLAMKYRKKTRPIARLIPVDIFPVKPDAQDNIFLTEISGGEVIYER